MKKALIVFIILLFNFSLHINATPVNYYVATDGLDTNDGLSINTPFLTVEHGLLNMACTDTLYIRGGTYNGQVGGYNDSGIPVCNSWANAITIQPYQGETVTWIAPNHDAVFGLATHDFPNRKDFYWIIKDIIIDGTNNVTFPIGGLYGDHVRLVNVEVKNGVGSGILPEGDYWEFLNLNVHNNGSSTQDHGGYFAGSHLLVVGGEYHHNSGYGIQFTDSGHFDHNFNTIYGARLHDNFYGLILSNGSNNIAYNNLIYNNTANGLSIAGSGACADCGIYYNTVTRNGQGIQIGYPDSPGAGGAIRPLVKGNIAINNGSLDMWIAGGFDGTLTNNLYTTQIQNDGQNYTVTGTVTSDPLLNNDYTLTNASSPAIGAGVNLTSIFSTDFRNSARDSSAMWDLGAYSYGSVISSPTLATVSPATGNQSQTLNLTLSGSNTNWVQGTSITSFSSSSGITVNSTTVNSATSITINITIASNATASTRSVTVTTGSEVVTKSSSFTIIAVPILSSVTPNSGARNQSPDLSISGVGTHFVQGTSVLSFSGSGITVNTPLTVVSSTLLAANITIASNAALTARDVTITTGAEVVTKNSSFLITLPATLDTVSPSTSAAGVTVNLTLSGTNTQWANEISVCSFSGSGVVVNSTLVGGTTSLTCNITIASNATLSARNVTVTTSGESETLNGGFTISGTTEVETLSSGFLVIASPPNSRGSGLGMRIAR